MSKKSKKFKNLVFIEDCGTYTNNVIVAIGSNFDEILRYTKRTKGVTDGSIKQLEESREDFLAAQERDYSGFVLRYKKGFQLMWLQPFDDQWEWFDTLIHESCHVTHHVLERKGIFNDEAFAYLQEHLVKKIRRRISRIYNL